MSSSERPPFPRDGWSTPEAAHEEAERTRQRLEQAEGKTPGAIPKSSPFPQPDVPSAPRFDGPMLAPAYGGPFRQQMARGRHRTVVLTIAGALVGLTLSLVLHPHAGPIVWALGGGGIGLVIGLGLRFLESR